MTGEQCLTLALVVGFGLQCSMALAEVSDPNSGQGHGYPIQSQYDEPKGSGKAIIFDTGAVTAPEKFQSSNDDKVTGYPEARIIETKGRGTWVEFDRGRVQYPGSYHDPADAVPMERKAEPQKSGEKELETPDLPEGLCPLRYDRDLFNRANRSRRGQLYSGLCIGDPYVVIETRVRDWKVPLPVRGGIDLLSTTYDPGERKWSARVYIPAGFLCGEGVQQVYQDDSLTADVSVLDIDSGLVLLLVDGRLAYLRPKGSPLLQWRMVWDTMIEVEFEPDRVVDEKKKKPKRKKKKKSKSKNRRRRSPSLKNR